MDKTAIRNFAVEARKSLKNTAIAEAGLYGITKDECKAPIQTGSDFEVYETLAGTENRIFGADIRRRSNLVKAINEQGFDQVIEETAYTWFNRIIAIRFMEINNYLPSRVRVLSSEVGSSTPDIISQVGAVDLGLTEYEFETVQTAKRENRYDDAFRLLFIKQCNELNEILPELFKKTDDYMELLLKISYTGDGVVKMLIDTIPEDDFDIESEGQVEIIGWMYQYYISEKHEEVVDPLHGKVVKKEDVPAATQLFTTDWVVKYLIDNSVGRYWIERNQDSKLADDLMYYVRRKDSPVIEDEKECIPQEVTVFDPCVGSGHFLVYAFDVLMKIYVEYGFSERDAAVEIVKNNLYGLDIDGRAVQLAYFAVMMKARQYDRRFFSRGVQPQIYEIRESNNVDNYSLQFFSNQDDDLRKDVETLVDTLKDAKEYGSILQLPPIDFDRINDRFTQLSEEISIYNPYLLGSFRYIIRPAELMSRKYAIVATNPPYLNKYDGKLKKYITERYKDYSGDLFSVFIYKNMDFCKADGYLGYMTPFVWMFIKTYEKLREYIIQNKSITSLIQFEYSAFEEATVPICSFVLNNLKGVQKGSYFRLSAFTGGMEVQKEKMLEALNNKECGYYFEADQNDFIKITGMPIAYRATESIINSYVNYPSIDTSSHVKKGMFTGKNDLFFRMWYEPAFSSIDFDVNEASEVKDNHYVPMNSGGAFRRWYGNRDKIIKFDKKHYDLITKNKGHRNPQFYFKKTAAWTKITSGKFSIRLTEKGFINNDSSMAVFEKSIPLEEVVGLLNSAVAQFYLSLENESLNYTTGNVASIPMKDDTANRNRIVEIVKDCVSVSKEDWDSYETSWDFKRHPFLTGEEPLIADRFKRWEEECNKRFIALKKNEEDLNAYYIKNYGLEGVVNQEVEDKDITVRKADLKDDIESFISFAVGCMFGRYSLDEPGLVYAGGIWDDTRYKTFIPDKDAIIPICDDEYFPDDIVGRFISFVEIVFGKDTVEDNLTFIANALGGGESARDVIRNYFINGFYSNHLKTYQKRPIYWLFDSGKNNGFKCLVYLHRYSPETLGLIRSDYLIKNQAMVENSLKNAEYIIQTSTSAVDKAQATKKRDKYIKQLAEIKDYYPAITHMALQKIDLDLDDGIKANYAKFQEIEVSIEGEKKRTVNLLAKI